MEKLNIKKLVSKNALLFIILGIGAGVLLIIINNFTDSFNDTPTIKSNDISMNLSTADTESFIEKQERKLTELINRISGISNTYVMITLESSGEYIYAQNTQIRENESKTNETENKTKDIQKEYVLFEDVKNSESPILIKEIEPKIKGVAVVCKGMDNTNTELKIIKLVATVLNISTNRIFVVNAD